MAWNGSNARMPEKSASARSQTVRSRVVKGCVAGLIVAFLGGLSLALLMPKNQQPNAETTPISPRLISESSPSLSTNRATAVETNDADMVTLPDGRRVKKPTSIAEAVALVRLTPGFHRFKNVDEVFSKTNEHQVGEYKPALFKHDVEGKLGMIATRRRDMVMPPMPPLPPNADRDFAASLTFSLAMVDGEDPKDTETKLRVEAMKLTMRELMETEGLTVEQAFRRIESEHNRLANMTQLYKGAYTKMRLTGDPDAEQFLQRANAKLREAGACEFDENAKTINP